MEQMEQYLESITYDIKKTRFSSFLFDNPE
jgi:hypothetical protein